MERLTKFGVVRNEGPIKISGPEKDRVPAGFEPHAAAIVAFVNLAMGGIPLQFDAQGIQRLLGTATAKLEHRGERRIEQLSRSKLSRLQSQSNSMLHSSFPSITRISSAPHRIL